MSQETIGVGTLTISDKAKRYVNQVMDSNRLSAGPFTKKFEKMFANMHDCEFAVMSNSGTSALHMALGALKEKHGWEDGTEVLVPATTFIATSNIVIYNNMVPVFVDVEKDYYSIDPKLIENKITDKTKAIIPVHLFGHPCDMDKIMQIAEKHGLRVIEDSCETMFAKYNGKSVGSFGDVGCFSTYVAHLLVTGVGGLSITNDDNLAVMMRSIMNHGRDSIYITIDDDKGKTGDELKDVIAKRFSFVRLGHSFRATEMESAIGLAHLEDRKDFIKKRRENAMILIDKLSKFSGNLQLPKIRPGSEHSFMMFPIVLNNEKKDKLVNFLESKGIETRDMLPLINQPIYKKIFNINPDDYPVSKWILENGFYIGCHQDVGEQEIARIVSAFEEYFQ